MTLLLNASRLGLAERWGTLGTNIDEIKICLAYRWRNTNMDEKRLQVRQSMYDAISVHIRDVELPLNGPRSRPTWIVLRHKLLHVAPQVEPV